ncbi:type I site-specific deoxyribonuclease, HsdR family [Pseudodesulfovibrio mercurii]|uniref:Type I restriction enzyme endonuclease subunit n=1 Tax=Pseudodesulfovibrio mercurii TaxID=641491 RepID=F0JKB0_9BACT|nr:type I restriction endonuclease subunit R [Pseudodesulfovibrio mercurii]EGB16359.1 type I site-specific deoxyribonuclease, HsdR family [Pseudodesulfovibrio mercurii]
MTEQQIEQGLIGELTDLKYTYRDDIRDRATLESNFREHFQALNRVQLTDGEFKRLLDEIISPDVFTAATMLREINDFTRDDGTPLNYTLVNIKDWCKNTFEVVNQLRINTDNSFQRYDVMLLINGIPVVQIELKTLGISPRRAMQQIVDYKKDPGNGYTKTLLCFVQLFIVSNQTETYYFANNNDRHFAFDADESFLPIYQHADEDNNKITHLSDFAESFLPKCTLATTINRYMVLVASERKMLMMRPYQIYAVKNIDQSIRENRGNGYVWHTTGSGKTLTSFKASTLLKLNPDIHKCLFVVDRKDLDRQTREEFNRFQEGCVEENTNTAALVRRLISDDYADKVIVTTIQKLGLALDETSKYNKSDKKNGKATFKERLEPLRDKRMAFIFDECHRSQFGQTHQTIKNFFPKAQLFGFTGTPIFPENATTRQIDGNIQTLRTTKDLFQNEFPAYTITNAIEDKNVLRFHVDYFKPDGENLPKPGTPVAKRAVIDAILAKHDAATGERRFNAIFATASINDAIEYYELFKQIQAEHQAADTDYVPVRVAAVFSPPAEGNPDVKQLQEDLPQELEDNQQEPEKKKEALKAIIADYNASYGTNHSIGEFDAYYQDVQQRIKDQKFPNRDLPKKGAEKIDITIVVDMLLTGFDSKYLNTLYVDKNLRYHGLIQAFSRTNRVLNSAKPYGHILDFRGQRDRVDEAIRLFSGARAEQAREIWLVDEAPVVIEQLKAAKQELDDFLQSQGLDPRPEAVPNLKGDEARAAFVKQFKEIQRLTTQLDQYTDLTEEQRKEIEQALPKDDARAFRGVYLETAKRLKARQDKAGGSATVGDSDRATQDVIDQLDFEFVLFASADIDYDYIMSLISRFSGQAPGQQEMKREELVRLIRSDAKFMGELDEITEYVRTLETGKPLTEEDVRVGYQIFKGERHASELAAIAHKHGLTNEALQTFVDAILDRMIFDGEQLTDLLEPLDLGWRERREKELALMDDLVPLLKKRADGRAISGLNAYEQ